MLCCMVRQPFFGEGGKPRLPEAERRSVGEFKRSGKSQSDDIGKRLVACNSACAKILLPTLPFSRISSLWLFLLLHPLLQERGQQEILDRQQSAGCQLALNSREWPALALFPAVFLILLKDMDLCLYPTREPRPG